MSDFTNETQSSDEISKTVSLFIQRSLYTTSKVKVFDEKIHAMKLKAKELFSVYIDQDFPYRGVAGRCLKDLR